MIVLYKLSNITANARLVLSSSDNPICFLLSRVACLKAKIGVKYYCYTKYFAL